MFGIDDQLASLAHGHAALVALAVAVLLGLRHASDPDHLAAVTTLIASDRDDGVQRAGRLGLAWGAGHATTLCILGVPIVIWAAYLPTGVQAAAEVAVGFVVMALAARLLVRWRRGQYHVHTHHHGPIEHRHLHPHAHGDAGAHPHAAHDHTETHPHAAHDHGHRPEAVLGRSPRQAYAIGLVHGVGGSAGVGILLLAGIGDSAVAAAALVLFAAATAASMAALSCGFGFVLTRESVARRLFALVPALGVVSLTFGAWYALAAL